jgi:hypothetical protein
LTDDNRISYLIGDEPAGDLDAEQRADMDDLLVVLADPAVWAEPSPELEDSVVAAISTAGTAAASTAAASTPPAPAPTNAAPAPTPPEAAPSAAPAKVVPLRRRRAVVAIVGLAAAVAAVVGLAIGLGGGSQRPTYHAALAGTPLAPAASGQATLVQTQSGWQVTLHAKGLPRLDNGQFYQAWLKNKAGVLVPIGTFNQPNDVTLWSGVPPTQYPVMTVTRQRANGNLNSSGQRVLTGTAYEQ